jgi:hypothetical protein
VRLLVASRCELGEGLAGGAMRGALDAMEGGCMSLMGNREKAAAVLSIHS